MRTALEKHCCRALGDIEPLPRAMQVRRPQYAAIEAAKQAAQMEILLDEWAGPRRWESIAALRTPFPRGHEHDLAHSVLATKLHQPQRAEDIRLDVVDRIVAGGLGKVVEARWNTTSVPGSFP